MDRNKEMSTQLAISPLAAFYHGTKGLLVCNVAAKRLHLYREPEHVLALVRTATQSSYEPAAPQDSQILRELQASQILIPAHVMVERNWSVGWNVEIEVDATFSAEQRLSLERCLRRIATARSRCSRLQLTLLLNSKSSSAVLKQVGDFTRELWRSCMPGGNAPVVGVRLDTSAISTDVAKVLDELGASPEVVDYSEITGQPANLEQVVELGRMGFVPSVTLACHRETDILAMARSVMDTVDGAIVSVAPAFGSVHMGYSCPGNQSFGDVDRTVDQLEAVASEIDADRLGEPWVSALTRVIVGRPAVINRVHLSGDGRMAASDDQAVSRPGLETLAWRPDCERCGLQAACTGYRSDRYRSACDSNERLASLMAYFECSFRLRLLPVVLEYLHDWVPERPTLGTVVAHFSNGLLELKEV